MDKATPTLRQRCDTALQSLPDAPYRAMLAALFDEMLAEVERLAAQAAPTDADRASSGATTAQAVRMLTGDDCREHLSRPWLTHEEDAAIAAFCAVNAGRTIPADGVIGGAA